MIQGYDDDHAMGGGDPVSATVKWFNPVKGFGFVQRGDGSPDAFLHISVVEQCGHRDLPEGTRITCNIAEGRKGLQVTQILSVDELAAPGTMVRTPAAASRPQSRPVALTVRVMVAAIGLATVVVSVRASNSSTQENMKQKKAVTPMPARISGMKTVVKKRGKL